MEKMKKAVYVLMYFNMPEIFFSKTCISHLNFWDLSHCWSKSNWRPVDAEQRKIVTLYLWYKKKGKQTSSQSVYWTQGWIR